MCFNEHTVHSLNPLVPKLASPIRALTQLPRAVDKCCPRKFPKLRAAGYPSPDERQVPQVPYKAKQTSLIFCIFSHKLPINHHVDCMLSE